MASIMNDSGRKAIAEAYWLDGARTFKLLLVDDTYVPNAAHDFVNDVVAKELPAAGGYSRKTLAGLAVVVASNRAECRADCPSWSALNDGTIGAAVVYEDMGGADSANPSVCTIDPADLVTEGVDTTLQVNGQAANGAVFKV